MTTIGLIWKHEQFASNKIRPIDMHSDDEGDLVQPACIADELTETIRLYSNVLICALKPLHADCFASV